MKISTKGRYGLRALIDLAANESSRATPLREISERQNISEQYLEQLFASLRKAGIVKSVRGAHGGYLLNDLPENITVKDVLTALEGPIAPVDCVLRENGKMECSSGADCVTYNLWLKMKENIDRLLESVTIAVLRDEYQKQKNGSTYMF